MCNRDHPWFMDVKAKFVDTLKFENRAKLRKGVFFTNLLGNSQFTPREVLQDLDDCYSSPQPTKKRHRGETINDKAFDPAEFKIPESP